MKKLLRHLACSALVVLLASASALAANSSTTVSSLWVTSYLYKTTVSWTADDSDGSVDNGTIGLPDPCYMFIGITDPGSTAPTDNYDIVVTDSLGADVFGTALNNRDTTTSEQAAPIIGGTYGGRLAEGELTFTLTNNSVNSATGTLTTYCLRAE